MNKIVRVLGKKGRITIPYEIRLALNIRSGNILSFDAKGNTITVTKEKLCDDCKSESEPLDSFVESLVLEERERLLKTQNSPEKLRHTVKAGRKISAVKKR